jgi:hypothetical protein
MITIYCKKFVATIVEKSDAPFRPTIVMNEVAVPLQSQLETLAPLPRRTIVNEKNLIEVAQTVHPWRLCSIYSAMQSYPPHKYR